MERYRPIIDDWNAFQAALAAPQPAVVRVNTLKTGMDAIRRRLADQGFRLRPYPWYPSLVRVDGGGYPVTKTLEHWLGYLYAQEAAAAVPALALGAEPGQRVLDLSAAPGGKTTQIAELQGDTGLLVANDPQPHRVQALLANVYRLGLVSVVVTSLDGRRFPAGPGFDRVLVDAPCSAEGNARRHPRAARGVSPRRRTSLARLQRALLLAGLQALADGGTLVYSTCTFAPEENEAVVDAVLRETRGAVIVEPIDQRLPGIPGITRWQGQDFHRSLAATRRIYPHHLDSGGMYVARLRRLGPPPQAAAPRQQPQPVIRADAELTRRFVDWWCRRFDLPATVLEGLYAYERGGDVWLSRHEAAPGWARVQAAGLRVARGGAGWRAGPGDSVGGAGDDAGGSPRWKPTSVGLVRFAAGARRNVVDVDTESLAGLLEGRRIDIAAGERVTSPAGPTTPVDGGFVALRWCGEVLGCGVVDARGLRSAIPQGRALELLACVEAWRGAGTIP